MGASNSVQSALLRGKLEGRVDEQLTAWTVDYLTLRPQPGGSTTVSEVAVCSTGAPQGTVLDTSDFRCNSDWVFTSASCANSSIIIYVAFLPHNS